VTTTATLYRCGVEGRRAAVGASASVNGIDFLEVSPDQKTLAVTFIHDYGLAGLTTANVVVEGGVRITPVRVTTVSAAASVLTVTVDRSGDYSTYRLRLRRSDTDESPPSNVDPQLSFVDFSFKASCLNEFDCETDVECPPSVLPEPELDYLAKDYTSFRRLMLDRLALLVPGWKERHAADAQVALVELLAYVGDHLSYFQDSVATEAYLATARKRTSLRRHARLLDYDAHAGCNARAWVAFETTAASVALPAGARLLVAERGAQPMLDPNDLDAVLKTKPVVFETVYGATLHKGNSSIELYTWSDDQCCLPKGATRATLTDTKPRTISLQAGDVVLFEEVRDPETGLLKADPDPSRSHAVRLTSVTKDVDSVPTDPVNVVEIEWADEDALPFPLCVSTLVGLPGEPPTLETAISVARGNVVLADHGLSIARKPSVAEPAVPTRVPEPAERRARPYRPRLAQAPVTFAAPIDLEHAAARSLENDSRHALPSVALEGEDKQWLPVRDLLGSGRFEPVFVVETEDDGTATIRFGDDEHGRRPEGGFDFGARYRIGNGTIGNVGAGVIRRVVLAGTGIKRVWNPLPAVGGTDPEPLEQIRLSAPAAFRFQKRAVTESDYAAVTEREPGVQRAAARFRWTGSWYTAFVAADRTGGRPGDATFISDTKSFLDGYRMAGHDLDVEQPVVVPLDIALDVCVKRGYFVFDVKRALERELGTGTFPDGRLGFFHPDNFTFGAPVYLSQIFGRASAVPGVRWVQAVRFQRYGKTANGELEAETIKVGPREIVRLDNDPSLPENGKLELTMKGGV
jgi:Baseplate J-like protein